MWPAAVQKAALANAKAAFCQLTERNDPALLVGPGSGLCQQNPLN
jgi:hypothetical protein